MPIKLSEPIKLKCKGCKSEFTSFHPDKIWCSPKCKNNYHRPEPKWKSVQSNCSICEEKYIKNRPNKIYCSAKCGVIARKANQKISNKKVVENTKIKKQLKKSETIKRKFSVDEKYLSIFNDLRFYKEAEFEHWFKVNYNLFGIKKLIKIDVYYPDVIAELHNGKKIRIELELYARNFIFHEHNPRDCELIISFIRSKDHTHIKGVPVISIFTGTVGHKGGNTDYNVNTLELTDYFLNLSKTLGDNLHNFLNINNIKYPDEIDIDAALTWKSKGKNK